MADRVSISDVPIFSRFSDTQLKAVWRLMRMAAYQPGDTVIEEGAPAATYFISLSRAKLPCAKGGGRR